MRNLYGFIILAGALAIAGCSKKEDALPPTASALPAPDNSTNNLNKDGYLGTLVRNDKAAVKGIDTAALNSEVQLFQVQEGRLPKDLNELVAKQYIPKVPDAPVGMKINYDPVSGKVTVVPQTVAPQ
jgi:PBP1b-binding outer membrane lipoprotein LpoB